MKRKRETKADGGEICRLGSEWTSKRRPPSRDDMGLSTLGFKYMSSRPSAIRSRFSLPNFHTNGLKTASQQGAPDDEEDDTEGDWISQLGAKYMTRKKLYEARSPLPDCSAHFSPREHELELDNELDNAWIADFGMQWMRRRCRTRRGRYKVHDDAWICELGFQWMSRSREREHANHTWLSDLSSQYMTRRKRELDRGIEELGLTAYRGFMEREPLADDLSLWETRRKLQYSNPDDVELHMKRSKANGHGLERVEKYELDAVKAPSTNGGSSSRPDVIEHILSNNVVQEVKRVDASGNSDCNLSLPQVVDSGSGLLEREEQVIDGLLDREEHVNAELLDREEQVNAELLDREEEQVTTGLLDRGEQVDTASDEFQVFDFDPLGDLEPTECVHLDDDDEASSSSSSS